MIRSRNLDRTSVAKQETIWFDEVATIGADVAVTTIQKRLLVPYRHKVVGAIGQAGTVNDDDENYAVYNTEDTPGAVIPLTKLVTANTSVAAASAARSTIRAAGYNYTLRAKTKASTGGLSNLRVGLIVEKLDTNE